MKKLAGILCAIAFVVIAQGAFIPQVHAETTTATTMSDPLKALMTKIAELQAQLAALRGEVREVLKDGLKEGMTDEDVKKVQELLATDKEIYPAGKVTGFFGPMTKEALKRFQEKNGLEVTGEINAETKALLEEYRKEKKMHTAPEGFMRAPGIMQKMRDGVCKQAPVAAWGRLCQNHGPKPDVKDKDKDDDHDEDEDEDEDDEDSEDSKDAKDAIDDAKDAIADVNTDIEAADSDVDTDTAEELLEDAEELLDDAEDAYDDEDYADAEKFAEDAEDKADEAADELEEAIEDAE